MGLCCSRTQILNMKEKTKSFRMPGQSPAEPTNPKEALAIGCKPYLVVYEIEYRRRNLTPPDLRPSATSERNFSFTLPTHPGYECSPVRQARFGALPPSHPYRSHPRLPVASSHPHTKSQVTKEKITIGRYIHRPIEPPTHEARDPEPGRVAKNQGKGR
jgi:hypothetical protein